MSQIDELIRGELAAVESIEKVLGGVDNDVEKNTLNTIKRDHEMAVSKLRSYASPQFNEKSRTSGPWGSFAEKFTSGASLFGDKATLQALKVGENHGLNEYRSALEWDSITPELRSIIKNELLPNQENHIKTIEGFLQ